MKQTAHKGCLARLHRIEGQVRGVARMIEDDRYCIDVVQQLQAVRSALKRVEDEVLKDHVEHCVDHAIRSGDRLNAAQWRKLQACTFHGNDVDSKMVSLASMNLALRGLPDVRILKRNVLTTSFDRQAKAEKVSVVRTIGTF